MEISEIVERLNCQLNSLAKMLLPGGRESGREWECGSINGEGGKSLKLCLSGAKMGRWSDFATGDGGDVLDLWAAAKGITLAQAVQEAKKYLGVEDPVLYRSKEKTFAKPEAKGVKKVAPQSAVMRYLTEERKLTPETIAAYRVAEVGQVGPWPSWKRQEPWVGPWVVFPYFRNGSLLGVKYLHLERDAKGKKNTLVESNCEPTCFGWHVIGPNDRELTLCEGEIDAMTLYQYGIPAASVPFGGGDKGKQQWVDYDWNELERFETINLCMDADDAGREAVQELVSRLGVHRCRVVTLPRKDANECLQDGVSAKEIRYAFETAVYIEPEELKKASDYTDAVTDRFYPQGGKPPGFDMPWDKIPFRFLRGEVTVITGCNGHGKSLMWGQIMLGAALQDEKVCIASLEMKPDSTLYRMERQFVGKKTPTKKVISESLEFLSDKIWLFAVVGTGKLDRMLEVFEYAYRRHGVKHFLIDSLMKLGLAEDDYNGQKAIMDRLCDWVNSNGAHVHLIAHPRKEDEDTPASKMSIKGTGAITDLAFNVFSVWRNKPKEDAIREYGETKILPKGKTIDDIKSLPDAMLVCNKSRNVEGVEGKYGLYFNPEALQYHAAPDMAAANIYDQMRKHYDGDDDCPY